MRLDKSKSEEAETKANPTDEIIISKVRAEMTKDIRNKKRSRPTFDTLNQISIHDLITAVNIWKESELVVTGR